MMLYQLLFVALFSSATAATEATDTNAEVPATVAPETETKKENNTEPAEEALRTVVAEVKPATEPAQKTERKLDFSIAIHEKDEAIEPYNKSYKSGDIEYEYSLDMKTNAPANYAVHKDLNEGANNARARQFEAMSRHHKPSAD